MIIIIIISSINSLLLLLYHRRHYCFSSFEDQGQKTVVAVSSHAGAISVYSLVETAWNGTDRHAMIKLLGGRGRETKKKRKKRKKERKKKKLGITYDCDHLLCPAMGTLWCFMQLCELKQLIFIVHKCMDGRVATDPRSRGYGYRPIVLVIHPLFP